MKKIFLLLCATSFVFTASLAFYVADAAFFRSLHWGLRFKNTLQVPDSVQAFLSFADMVFMVSTAVLITQIVGLFALLKFSKACNHDSPAPNSLVEPTPGKSHHVS